MADPVRGTSGDAPAKGGPAPGLGPAGDGGHSPREDDALVVVEDIPPEDSSGLPPLVKIATVLVILGAAVAFLLFGSQASDAFVYSKLVHEVLVDPDAFRGRELRVEGDLKQGSVRFREDPCEWRFVLAKEDKELPVHFPQCIVPDTFRDGMGLTVTVQGRLKRDGSFLANQVIPRCPSKYEMKKRMEAGEQMPHAPLVGSMPELPPPSVP